jgi:MFS family permease
MSAAPRSSPIPPGAWWALALLSGLNLLNYLDRQVMSAVLTPLQRDLSLNDADAGWASSAFMLGYFISAPFFGYVGDRWPRRYLMPAGVAIWSLATAGSGLAGSFAQLFAIRMAVGVGESCFVTLGPSWISDLFASTRRNTALTLFYIAIPVGSAIGYTLGGHFAQHGDWRGAFIYAGLPGIMLALSLLLLREPRRGEADGLAGGTVPTARVREIGSLLTNRRYALLVWGYTAQTFAIGAFATWGPTFLVRAHGLSLAFSGEVFGAMLAGAGLVATVLGGLGANLLRARMPAGYVWVMGLSLVLAAPLCFVALMAGDTTQCLVGLGASMFFIFLPTGPIVSEIYEIVPVHLRASAMAMCIFTTHLFGDFGSPALVGWLSNEWQSLQRAVLILPGVLAVGALLWCWLITFTRTPHEVEA